VTETLLLSDVNASLINVITSCNTYILVEVHHNLKLWTTSQSLSPNASNCDEEIEVFLLLIAVASLASKMFPTFLYLENCLSKYTVFFYTELAGVDKN